MKLLATVQRPLMVGAAIVFVVFAVVALVLNRLGVSEQALSVVAGLSAYLFLAYAALLFVRAWLRRGADAGAEAVAFVRSHPRVLALVGAPVTVGEPEGEVPTAGGPAQANLDVVVSGPAGIGRVDLVMARMGRRWEVLTAALTAEGERVLLRGDGTRAESDSDDDIG